MYEYYMNIIKKKIDTLRKYYIFVLRANIY